MRMRRRFGRPLPVGAGYQRPIPPMLIEANRLLAEGNYRQAAEVFERLAAGAVERQGPRAPYLFLQAGRARYMAQEASTGAILIRRGLSLFAEQGRLKELKRAGTNVVRGLRDQQHLEDAKEFRTWLEMSFPGCEVEATDRLPGAVIRPYRPTLPLKCPSCGAPVNPLEIEWVTEETAECIYCGNMLRGDIV
jgi:hypothetical protein